MAEAFNVQGPVRMEIASSPESTPSWVSFGFSDNDDLFRYEEEVFSEPLYSTDHGDEPGDYVYRGVIGTLTGTLVKWDQDLAATDPMPIVMTKPGATIAADDPGRAGVIGSTWITGGHYFGVRLTPLTAGKRQYTFPRCVLASPAAIQILDHGNTAKRLSIQVRVLRDGTNATLADGSSVTAALFSTATTS